MLLPTSWLSRLRSRDRVKKLFLLIIIIMPHATEHYLSHLRPGLAYGLTLSLALSTLSLISIRLDKLDHNACRGVR